MWPLWESFRMFLRTTHVHSSPVQRSPIMTHSSRVCTFSYQPALKQLTGGSWRIWLQAYGHKCPHEFKGVKSRFWWTHQHTGGMWITTMCGSLWLQILKWHWSNCLFPFVCVMYDNIKMLQWNFHIYGVQLLPKWKLHDLCFSVSHTSSHWVSNWLLLYILDILIFTLYNLNVEADQTPLFVICDSFMMKMKGRHFHGHFHIVQSHNGLFWQF